MNFKKRVNGSWTDTSHYIHNTSTDIITTLPAVIYPTGTTATVGLKGQTTQSSIPSPTSPVMPQGTGERTGNLFDLNRSYSSSFTTDVSKWMTGAATTNNTGGGYAESVIGDDSVTVTSKVAGYGASFLIYVSPNTTYTISFETDKTSSGSFAGFSERDNEGNILRNGAIQSNSTTITTGQNCAFLNLCFRFPPADGKVKFSKIMLNTGSQPLPYEPFGVKIPISSTNTTTPVYLGQVESTRRIKKLVLTGQETSWAKASSAKVYYLWQYDDDALNSENIISCMCSHYSAQGNVATVSGVENLKCCFRTTAQTFYIHDDAFESNTDFVTYLQQQYAAGTPVTVWYVLATPTTGIVNEPLRKIGDYADTLSNISIPVTAGGDTLSIGTTVQPSEVTVNYKGWHPVADVHERDNGAWT